MKPKELLDLKKFSSYFFFFLELDLKDLLVSPIQYTYSHPK
jgi:hypothetical protein